MITIAHLCRLGTQKLRSFGVEAPAFEAQLILSHVLNCSRLELIAHPDNAVSEVEKQCFEELLSRRMAREPLAYILGRKEFYGLEIAVSPGVLIPRPETELLVDVCIKRLGKGEYVLVDVGTGSGAIAVALASNLPQSTVYAVDISASALQVAKYNIQSYSLEDRVHLAQGDLLEPISDKMFHAVISNPPYVPSSQIPLLEPEIALHEPVEALDGGEDGLEVYRRLIPAALNLLRECGFLAVEVGYSQAESVAQLFQSAGYNTVETFRDLSGIERVVVGTK